MLWPGNHRGSPWDGTDGSRRLYEVSHDNDCLCVVPTYNNNETPCFGLTAPSWPSTATTPTSSRTLPHHCEQNISMVEVDSGSARVGSGAGGEATLTRRQPILPISRPGLDSTTGRVVEGGDAGCERSEQEEVMVGEAAGTWTGDRLSGGKSHAKAASRRVGKVAEGEGEEPDASMFSCNICMEMASHAVVTMCGHLYCWALPVSVAADAEERADMPGVQGWCGSGQGDPGVWSRREWRPAEHGWRVGGGAAETAGAAPSAGGVGEAGVARRYIGESCGVYAEYRSVSGRIW